MCQERRILETQQQEAEVITKDYAHYYASTGLMTGFKKSNLIDICITYMNVLSIY
jgi:hypothetical protein